jgi:UDP-glucose 4-epimerase
MKKVSGVDFPVEMTARRQNETAAIVAANERIRAALNWTPQYDDLETIVRQAFDWERRLAAHSDQPRRAGAAAATNMGYAPRSPRC